MMMHDCTVFLKKQRTRSILETRPGTVSTLKGKRLDPGTVGIGRVFIQLSNRFNYKSYPRVSFSACFERPRTVDRRNCDQVSNVVVSLY